MSYRSSIDRYEDRKDEPIIAEEYKKYLKWIEDIKAICDEKNLVSRATGEKTVFEDEMEENYYDPEHDENTMDHYLLDNGLHVYVKDGVVRIQDVDEFYASRCMELRDNNISIFLGADGPELPYQITYDSKNNMFGNLPVKGLIRNQSDIRDILDSGLKYYLDKFKDKPEPDNLWMKPSKGIEVFESTIALYDKISDMVKIFQQQKSESTSDLQQRESELSSLEAEARAIDEAEALIDQQKNGQNIGEE